MVFPLRSNRVFLIESIDMKSEVAPPSCGHKDATLKVATRVRDCHILGPIYHYA